jgi:hypothetical protein
VAKSGRRPGLVLVSWARARGQAGSVWLLGCRGEPRLEINTGSIVWDIHLLQGGRLLLAEQESPGGAGSVTIRDLEGEVLWKYAAAGPLACYPLTGGNLLVTTFTEATEVTPAGQPAWSHNFIRGRREVPSLECPQQLPNGNFVGISEPGRRRVDLVETDPGGTRRVKQVTLQDAVSRFRRVRIEASARGTYFLAGTTDRVVREIDGSGKTMWKSPLRGASDFAQLKDGTLVVAAGHRVVEITRAGGVTWEALLAAQASAQAARPCLRLVRLGFDAPRPADLDLDASVEYRLAGLKSREPFARWWSARLLGDMGRKAEAAVPTLIRALDDPDPLTRSEASGALGQVVGPKTLPLLLSALTSKSPRVRVAVISACGSHKNQAKAIIPALVKLLKDYETVEGEPRFKGLKVCQAAAIALGNHGPSAAEAVPALVEALKSDDAVLRILAASSLGSIGPRAKAAVPALKEALNDPEKRVREVAAESLKKIQR